MTQIPSAGALKRTPLYDVHRKAGAKMVPFGGWEMPVQYTGILEEHRTVRGRVGLFDVSHMGEFEIDGAGALDAVQRLTTNDASQLEVGQLQYSLLCYPDGGIVDDATVYRLGAERFMITVNASNIDKDWAWATAQAPSPGWRNVSPATGLIAVQGPRAEALVGRLADRDVTAIGYFRFARGRVAGVPALISRSGYTGEDGFELYAPWDETERLWRALLASGAADEMVVRHARHIRVSEPPDQPLGLRPLHREERRLRAHVRPLRVAAAVRRDPRPVLVDVRRVHCQHEPVVV